MKSKGLLKSFSLVRQEVKCDVPKILVKCR